MKKIALSVTGGLLFVAVYYHVHRQADYIAARHTVAGSQTHTAPLLLPPLKSLPAFAFRLD